MQFCTIILTILLSIFSTSVMAYISLATPIGPWIAPTLVLLALLLSKIFLISDNQLNRTLVLATAGGSVGGIIATAFGFSFPTLFFLDAAVFNQWLSSPFYFITVLGALSFAAGSFGYLIASHLHESLLIKQQLAFPIGQLTHKLISAGNSMRKAYELTAGFASTFIFFLFQDGFYTFQGVGRTVSVLTPHALGLLYVPALNLRLDTLPMLISIGFVTGHVIALPLAVGALAKIVVIEPVHHYFFATLTSESFVLAFCSGIVLIGALQSFFDLPKMVRTGITTIKTKNVSSSYFTAIRSYISLESIFIGGFIVIFLSLFKFSFLSQLYLLIGSFLCAYNILLIAGKMGLAPLGRFATFVMVPALLLFGIDAIKVTFIATFVEVCCGVAADLLFGARMGQLAQIDYQEIRRYQLLGLLVSSCTIGIIFWLLIGHFGIGSEILIAQRAQARALLVTAHQFDWYVLALGMLFGWLLKKIKVNAVMVLGGLLMAPNISIALILGGVLALLVKNREEWEPFWSGVFATNSIIELVKTIV